MFGLLAMARQFLRRVSTSVWKASQNAIEQAEAIAANIMGANTPYEAKPWFWSDHYDVKLQIAGLNTDYNAVVVRDGKKLTPYPTGITTTHVCWP